MTLPWVRLWSDMPTDPKWRVIAKRSGRPLPEVLAVFVHMLTNAGANATERGVLANWCHDDIAAALDMEPEHVAAIHDAMQGKTLDGSSLTGWEKRQPKREDNSAERAKAWRDRKRTQSNAEKRPDTDTEADTEKSECEIARESVIETEDAIRHRAFVISLPAIELAVIRSGLPKAEIRTRCKAHALQWAAEIDGGKLSRDVVPQKIVNFLASTIMGEVNRDSRPIHRATGYPAPTPKRGVMDVIREAQAREAAA